MSNFHRIPAELKRYAQFVVWRYQFRDGNPKRTKVPYSARTLRHASVTDSSTWATFEEAVAACAPKANGTASGLDGIGFVFTEGDPFAGVDLDSSNDLSIIERQKGLFDAFESYSERSPSGDGLHIIVRGEVPSGRRRDCIEVYSSHRFFTMTGDVYRDAPIADRQAELDKLFIALGGTIPKAPALPLLAATASDDEILRRMFSAKNGETIRALYDGDATAVKGNDRSGSAIDQALVDHIQFYTSNRDQIERIWRNSPHGQREKTQSRPEYRKRTIDRAFDRELPQVEIIPLSYDFGFDAGRPQQGSSQLAIEPPRPLRREMAPAKPFPVDALGPLLSGAAKAISEKIQCPPAIGAMSVLGAASLAVQAHADVVIPATGHSKPLSLFLVTIAASGERKSAADAEAKRPIDLFEKEYRQTYDSAFAAFSNKRDAWESSRDQIRREKTLGLEAKEAELAKLGPAPSPPLRPLLTCPEPTFEGLCRLYVDGFPMLGIFSDEGGQFIGGHGLSKDSRLATIAGLSAVWDGSAIKRVRAIDGVSVLPGRRLAVHLMVQPDAASLLLADPMIRDQGFLSRILPSAPESLAGKRFQNSNGPQTESALNAYTDCVLAILRTRPPLASDKQNELEPRRLALSAAAEKMWSDYADSVERRLGKGGEFETISGFANKLPEHAARLAGVLELVGDLNAPSITANTFENAMVLAEYFASEALRMFDAGMVSPDIRLAEQLLDWLHSKWSEPYIGLKVIYQQGPSPVRQKSTAERMVAILEDHGWLEPASASGVRVNDAPVKKAWRIIRDVRHGLATPAIPRLRKTG